MQPEASKVRQSKQRRGQNRVMRHTLCKGIMNGIVAGGMIVGSVAAGHADVVVKTIAYKGWNNAVQMSNGTVEVVIVPQIGRIMRYGPPDGPNALWNNPDLLGKTTDMSGTSKEWANYGGDKVWPAPQERWGWPPDRTLDSGLQSVKTLPNHHVLMTGPVVEKLGVQFRREIALDPTGTGVTITNTLVNAGQKDVDWSIWEVAQTDDPMEARLTLNKPGRFPTGYYVFGEDPLAPDAFSLTETQLVMKRSATRSAKVGGDAPGGQLEALVGGMKFTFSSPVEPGGTYPDKGCSQEIYTNPDPARYVELELLGPMKPLKPGASRPLVTHWSLTK